ncbi:hypothetical protein [Janthinobacterium sp. 17J80-10]|uniref:hypothetical protein n=1 Tax=Janthinobacterium sp. 17J80-10 TaxID=2497863 RepID=UPI00100595CD|nr:hypothetical protein [Janthinobacterium sp. 17J80-10]QAU34143.1 hypothetical protein EKL02_08050 [Janthinobacterium sp. 17J80-10]
MVKLFHYLFLALMFAGACDSAQARPGHHHGRSRAHVGVYVGPALGWSLQGWNHVAPYPYNPYAYSPYYAYPPYYYPSSPNVVVVPSAPAGYIEQTSPDYGQRTQPAQPAPQDWYYCKKPEGYYPYVKRCPGGWQRVPAQPPE